MPSCESTEELRELTADPRRWADLAHDEGFQGGLRLATPYLRGLSQHALLVIQPDCISAGQAPACVDFVRAHGFEPVHHVRFRMAPHITAALWHSRSTTSTPDCLAVTDAVCGHADSVFVLLRDTTPTHLPASLRLTHLKGPAKPARRRPGQLRVALGSPNLLLAYVHTSDEPADLLRESHLMGADVTTYAAMTAQLDPAATPRLLAELESMATDHSDMTPTAALNRLLALTPPDHPATKALLATRDGAYLNWLQFRAHLIDLGINPNSWDPLLVASQYIVYDLPA
ncbi:hypothetical protein JOD54_004822 [Actinokineospora baliensis]|uniref:nucleoside-diphosphate kinase n=1 Tax=Actinokineospora baliensis TaxID=547056 RepID=UPI001959BCD6|nr:nucleoside-diphosphate kinase [Actinokineospora baliensis]MBM7774618.1 hypothetical protein [Actinokineospora baliensis]